MKFLFKYLMVVPFLLMSCGGNDCPDKTWCDKGDTLEYFIDNQKNNGSIMGLTDVLITYNKNSKLFELQVILENGDFFLFSQECYTPILQIRGGEWKVEDILEDVEILDKTDRKLSFKSSVLERTFGDKNTRVQNDELYGIIFDFKREVSFPRCIGRGSKLSMVWGM